MVRSSRRELSWLILAALLGALIFCLLFGYSSLEGDVVSLTMFSRTFDLSPALFIAIASGFLYFLLLIFRKATFR